MNLPYILIIAGSDSSAGAGIVRDIETAHDFSCKSCLAVTAVTAQTHKQVIAVKSLSPDLLKQQIETALIVNSVKAIKIGMVATAENIVAIKSVLKNYKHIPVIYDPVLAASSGYSLGRDNIALEITNTFLPFIDLLTPNIYELAVLTQQQGAKTYQQALDQAHKLIEKGAKAILVKGGHLEGKQACDYLVEKQKISIYAKPRLKVEMRGTGCTLSTAIACGLAKGESLSLAIGHAKDYLFAKLTLISS